MKNIRQSVAAVTRPRLVHSQRGFDPFAAREQFRTAMRRAGLDPEAPIVTDAQIHRFKTSLAKGWYVYHEQFDHSWGAYGDYRSGEQFSWSSRKLSSEERSRIAQERRANDAAENQPSWALREARQVWTWSRGAPASHPYLRRKGIEPHGVHFYHGRRVLADVAVDGALVVPIDDDNDELQAIQFICPDGVKRNLGPTSGGHFWIGTPKSRRTLCLAEGFATAASVHEETGYACCVAFGVAGYDHVARYIRDQFEPKRLVIVADGDEPGIKAANAAARAVDALVFVCDEGQDFNDMARGRLA
jgi:putative DNA primase/helicase